MNYLAVFNHVHVLVWKILKIGPKLTPVHLKDGDKLILNSLNRPKITPNTLTIYLDGILQKESLKYMIFH